MGESLAVSRDWLTLGGAVSSGPARPQMSKHHIIEIKGLANSIPFLVLHAFPEPCCSPIEREDLVPLTVSLEDLCDCLSAQVVETALCGFHS